MAKYSLVAYENADPTNRVKALLFTPKPMGTSALPMVVYIPGNGELGEVGRHFRQPVILDRVTSRAFQGKYPCFLLALTPPHGATTLLGCAIPLACGFYDAPYAQWMMDNTIPRLIWYLLPVPLFAWSHPRRGHAILQNVGIDFKG